jgi:hypothetical protein
LTALVKGADGRIHLANFDKEQQERFDGKMQGFSVLTKDSGHCSWGSSLYRHRVLCYMFSILTAPKCEKGPNICYIL